MMLFRSRKALPLAFANDRFSGHLHHFRNDNETRSRLILIIPVSDYLEAACKADIRLAFRKKNQITGCAYKKI
jgi:hypothetical protein